MRTIFGDASYYVALLSPTDVDHARAERLSRTLRCRIVTTDFVLLELGAAFSRVHLRPLFIGLVSHLRSDPSTTVLPATRDLFDHGYDLSLRQNP